MAQPNISTNQYDDLRKEVARRYEQLHPDVKAALVSVNTASAVYEIGKKFGLNTEKTGYLADVIGYTIIGLLPVADFTQNLKDALVVDGAKTEEISREVSAKIFLAIREQLKKTHGEKWGELGMTAPQAANDKEQVVKKPTQTAAVPHVPMAMKSPWEIKPDGFRKDGEVKSVIPPVKPKVRIMEPVVRETAKATEAEVKKTALMPPEPPKTREAPQPAPTPHAPEILKEIKPVRQEIKVQGSEIKETALKPEMPKAAPPAGLPVIKEAEKMMQEPELKKPKTGGQQPTTETSPMPKPETSKPQAPLQPAPTPTEKYAADPYREPIE